MPIGNNQSNTQTNGTGNSYMGGSLKLQQQQQQQRSKSPPPAPPPSSTNNIQQHHQTQNRLIMTTNNNNSNSNNLSSPPPPPPPPPAVKPNEQHFNARVLYTYIPVNSDELPIQENEIVQVIRLVNVYFNLVPS